MNDDVYTTLLDRVDRYELRWKRIIVAVVHLFG